MNLPFQQFKPTEIHFARELIAKAEKELGPGLFEPGSGMSKIDLLLDNLPFIKTVRDARELVRLTELPT